MPPRLRLLARPNAESFFPSLGKETFRRTSILWRDQRLAGGSCSSCDMGSSIKLFPSGCLYLWYLDIRTLRKNFNGTADTCTLAGNERPIEQAFAASMERL